LPVDDSRSCVSTRICHSFRDMVWEWRNSATASSVAQLAGIGARRIAGELTPYQPRILCRSLTTHSAISRLGTERI
jgi:hypothetical protein